MHPLYTVGMEGEGCCECGVKIAVWHPLYTVGVDDFIFCPQLPIMYGEQVPRNLLNNALLCGLKAICPEKINNIPAQIKTKQEFKTVYFLIFVI